MPNFQRVPTVAVVLCAGSGSRFEDLEGRPKLLQPLKGKPLVSWALAHAAAAGLEATVAVTGPTDLSRVAPDGVTLITNPSWRDGIATSLGVALTWAGKHGFGAVVVGLGDQPLVPPAAWRAVAGSNEALAVATYSGKRRNPVRLAQSVWAELPLTGEEGARALMRRRPELVQEVPCDGDPLDVDTLEDLERARRATRGDPSIRPNGCEHR